MEHLSVRTEPPDAELTIDGRPAPNPFDGELARDEAHRVEASLAGYVSDSATVMLDRSRRLVLTLQAKPPQKVASPRRRTAPRTRAKARRPAKPTPEDPFVSNNPY